MSKSVVAYTIRTFTTETAILYIHNYLINAIGSPKYHVSVFLTSLLHLKLLIIASYCLVFYRGLG